MRKLDLVLETTEIDRVTLTIVSELVLHDDGSVTGSGALVAGDGAVRFAVTGTHREVRMLRALARG